MHFKTNKLGDFHRLLKSNVVENLGRKKLRSGKWYNREFTFQLQLEKRIKVKTEWKQIAINTKKLDSSAFRVIADHAHGRHHPTC